MYILTDKYSRFSEHSTGVQLDAVLDPVTRCHIAAAHVPDDAPNADAVRKAFGKMAGFSLWNDDDYRDRMQRKPEAAPAPDQVETGDPLTDQAAHVYSADELAGMKMQDLKPIAERCGFKVVPGVTKDLVVAAIVDAQSTGTSDAATAALLSGPKPPSSGGE